MLCNFLTELAKMKSMCTIFRKAKESTTPIICYDDQKKCSLKY